MKYFLYTILELFLALLYAPIYLAELSLSNMMEYTHMKRNVIIFDKMSTNERYHHRVAKEKLQNVRGLHLGDKWYVRDCAMGKAAVIRFHRNSDGHEGEVAVCQRYHDDSEKRMETAKFIARLANEQFERERNQGLVSNNINRWNKEEEKEI